MEPHRQRARRRHDEAGIYPAPLPAEFYARSVLDVARDLLGKLVLRRLPGEPGAPPLAVRIVEVEAYGGRIDRAAHSYRGETPRCRTMFGPVGRLYVYLSHGLHRCANVVAGSREEAAAVLLRAALPWSLAKSAPATAADEAETAVARLRAARSARARTASARTRIARLDPLLLLRGPGNFAAALALGPEDDGRDLTSGTGPLWIADGPAPARAIWTWRIGLGDYPESRWGWRALEPDNAATSPTPSASPRRRAPWPTLEAARRLHARAPARARR